jgi:hypothetical protein
LAASTLLDFPQLAISTIASATAEAAGAILTQL